MTYEELERQYKPLLIKFAGWNIGMEHEDLLQELRIILLKAQRHYDPSKGKFMTYLYRSLLNRVLRLRERTTFSKTRIPYENLIPLEDVENVLAASDDGNLGVAEILGGIQRPEARTIALLILNGQMKDEDWIQWGLSPRQVQSGVKHLKRVLKEDYDG
jgi:RNA polymerase sigma factor (sigma-70 family)